MDRNFVRALQAADGLLVTDDMIASARDLKACCILHLPAEKMLRLTAGSHYQDIIDRAAPLSAYNEGARHGQITQMPYLVVSRAKGDVVTHEGRHRSAAVMKALGPSATVPVAIILKKPDGNFDWREETWSFAPTRRTTTYRTCKDVPATLRAQYGDYKTRISKAGAIDLWE